MDQVEDNGPRWFREEAQYPPAKKSPTARQQKQPQGYQAGSLSRCEGSNLDGF